MSDPLMDIGWLTDPVSQAKFVSDYWETKPLVVTRNSPGYYQDLLTLDNFDTLISGLGTHSARIRTAGGVDNPPSGAEADSVWHRANGTEALYSRFRQGATIIAQSIHEEWSPLRDLCRALSDTFSAAFQVNAYLTPSDSRGLNPHYDTHDVLVLQLHGKKRWQIFDEGFRLPLEGQSHHGEVKSQDPSQIVDLEPGDMIYLPRGWGHVADALDEMSLHLTVGAYPLSWAMIMLQAVENLVARDERFRKSIPPGFSNMASAKAKAENEAEELLDRLRANLNPADLIGYAEIGARLASQPALNGHLVDLARCSSIDSQTKLVRRIGVSATLSRRPEGSAVEFHGKSISLPDEFLDPVQTLLENNSAFAVSSLSTDLNPKDIVVLARRLVEEGLLTFAEDATATV